MTEDQWEQVIRQAIKEALAAERALIEEAIEKHARGADHLALKAMIKHEADQAAREEKAQKRWDQVRTTVIGGVVLGLLFWIGSGAMHFIQWVWQHMPHPGP